MAVTVTSRQSWGSRLKGAFKGILVGLILVPLAIWILFSNEGRAVHRYKALKQGASDVVSVAAERVDSGNEGRLVHVSGGTATNDMLRDPQFGIAIKAIHLEREVEMYQWQEDESSETKKKVGGSTETTKTYSYREGWSDRVIDSSSFQQPAGHRNPTSMPLAATSQSASTVTLGAFRLSPSQIGRIQDWEPKTPRSTSGLPPALESLARITEDGVFFGADPASPRIGDLRVTFRVVKPPTVSLVAQQQGGSFTPYVTKTGNVSLLRTGAATAAEMFEAAQKANSIMTWVLRALGVLLMTLGFRMTLGPLSVLADVLPVLGNLVEKGVGGLALAIALPISLVTIAIGWLFYRPLLGVTLLALAIAATVLLWRKFRRAKKEVADLPPIPDLPPPPQPAG